MVVPRWHALGPRPRQARGRVHFGPGCRFCERALTFCSALRHGACPAWHDPIVRRLPHTVLHSRLFLSPRRGRGPLSGTAALRAGLPPQCQRTELAVVALAEAAPWRRASNAIPPAGGTFGNKVSTGTAKQCSAWGKVGLPPCEVACGALPVYPRRGDTARAPRGTLRWRRPRIPGDPSYLRQHPRSQG